MRRISQALPAPARRLHRVLPGAVALAIVTSACHDQPIAPPSPAGDAVAAAAPLLKQPDLVARAPRVVPGTVTSGARAVAFVVIVNAGTAGVTKNFGWRVWLDNRIVASGRVAIPIAAKDSVILPTTGIDLGAATAGTHVVLLEVDTGNEIMDLTRANNRASSILTVNPLPKASPRRVTIRVRDTRGNPVTGVRLMVLDMFGSYGPTLDGRGTATLTVQSGSLWILTWDDRRSPLYSAGLLVPNVSASTYDVTIQPRVSSAVDARLVYSNLVNVLTTSADVLWEFLEVLELGKMTKAVPGPYLGYGLGAIGQPQPTTVSFAVYRDKAGKQQWGIQVNGTAFRQVTSLLPAVAVPMQKPCNGTSHRGHPVCPSFPL
jgi:hypothetical protein